MAVATVESNHENWDQFFKRLGKTRKDYDSRIVRIRLNFTEQMMFKRSRIVLMLAVTNISSLQTVSVLETMTKQCDTSKTMSNTVF